MLLACVVSYPFLAPFVHLQGFSIDSSSFLFIQRVVNIGATALVTEAATAMFGEADVSAATGVMTEEADTQEGRVIQLEEEIKDIRQKYKQELQEALIHREHLQQVELFDYGFQILHCKYVNEALGCSSN
ncbi:Golgin candidate 5 [Vigna angularis]|uniref:Golgin candidate 5 n=1 Tax=Phaseolus angularis TaxID=3914 RepID=A0A8T0LDY5_PHAAN|nr:Golgin candidate 5 [Vigna angularis]